MKNSKTAVVAGATGLIGSELLRILIKAQQYSKITVLSRRKLDIIHPKVNLQVIDFDKLNEVEFVADDAFCCLGTTRKKAGSKAKFYQVDFTYVLDFATTAQKNGAAQFLMVSSMGANPKSKFYYNQVKGEVEDAVKQLNFEHTHIFRPSLLLGNRSEKRLGEDIGKVISSVLNPVIPPKYKGIQGKQVANAMYQIATKSEKGFHIYESDLLRTIENV